MHERTLCDTSLRPPLSLERLSRMSRVKWWGLSRQRGSAGCRVLYVQKRAQEHQLSRVPSTSSSPCFVLTQSLRLAKFCILYVVSRRWPSVETSSTLRRRLGTSTRQLSHGQQGPSPRPHSLILWSSLFANALLHHVRCFSTLR